MTSQTAGKSGDADAPLRLSPGPLLAGKRGLIMGAANRHSIAWGIARVLHAAGAELAFTCQNEALAKRIAPMTEQLAAPPPLLCDVNAEGGEPRSVPAMFATLARHWTDGLDFVVHSIAGAARHDLSGPYYKVSAQNFRLALLTSCYSLTEVARAAVPHLRAGGSLLSLSYLGAERVVPNYNIMGVAKAALEASVRYLAHDLGPAGVRINVISAGPVRTASGAAISSGRHIYGWSRRNAPLGRNPDSESLGYGALYLLSPLSAGVTGEVHYIDGGMRIVGIPRTDAPSAEGSMP